MKKHLKITLILFIILSIVLSVDYYNITKATSDNLEVKTVIIDAGHGAFDCGGIADDGVFEKDINLALAKKLDYVLKLYGINTIMTRTDDTALGKTETDSKTNKVKDTKARVALMKENPNAIFISIHQNKFSDASVKGFQTFYKKGDENAKLLAEFIQNSFVDGLKPDKVRVAKSDNRNVYILEKSTIPTVIVECGFLSNPEDLQNLKSSAYQGKIAFKVAEGILKYIKGNYENERKN